jgi:hypothetical protein
VYGIRWNHRSFMAIPDRLLSGRWGHQTIMVTP